MIQLKGVFYNSYRADQLHILVQFSNIFESDVLVEMTGKELTDDRGDIFYDKNVTCDTSKRVFSIQFHGIMHCQKNSFDCSGIPPFNWN